MKPQLPDYVNEIKIIPEDRANELASDAMRLAFSILASISTKTEEEVKDTFSTWFAEKGRKLLSMDQKSARDFLGEEAPDFLGEFLEEHIL